MPPSERLWWWVVVELCIYALADIKGGVSRAGLESEHSSVVDFRDFLVSDVVGTELLNYVYVVVVVGYSRVQNGMRRVEYCFTVPTAFHKSVDGVSDLVVEGAP